ncbi:hypothetical protein C7S16_5891 [Burkholderia thailandensis]|uniref:Uncharacterized protein n=1 Tax=Burkholderia thailandensis TaxID=57975 RepID=A0AAW9CU13_BURTH|nr:hypothetical protein [Burkholderia thailandensis]
MICLKSIFIKTPHFLQIHSGRSSLKFICFVVDCVPFQSSGLVRRHRRRSPIGCTEAPTVARFRFNACRLNRRRRKDGAGMPMIGRFPNGVPPVVRIRLIA